MRELRGVIIEETHGASANGAGAIPVDAAREMLRTRIQQLMQSAIQFHEEALAGQIEPDEAR